MNLKLVSIIIPYYNASAFIERTIDYAKSQEQVDAEIILVNDGSDNFNSQVLQKYVDKIDLLITQENKGQAAARNAGIKHAKGEYILNWDSDDFFEPSFCRKAIQVFETDPDIKLVACEALRTADGLNGKLIRPHGGDYTNFLFENAALGSAMFKRKDWEAVGGYDEAQELRGFEDWDFYLRLLHPTGRAAVMPERLFTYVRHAESSTSKIINEQSGLSKRKYIYLKNELIYGQHYKRVVEDVFQRLENERKERYKNLKRIDYILGYKMLKPLRLIKSLLK